MDANDINWIWIQMPMIWMMWISMPMIWMIWIMDKDNPLEIDQHDDMDAYDTCKVGSKLSFGHLKGFIQFVIWSNPLNVVKILD